MTNSDHAEGWDGVERRAGGNNPRRVAIVFSGGASRQERSEPYPERLPYPNNLLAVPPAGGSAPSVAEV